MSIKFIAIGNVLMKDDGIAIQVTRIIEEELSKRGIEVIYGETDFLYCLSRVEKEDFIIILDAALYGKDLGEITIMPIESYLVNKSPYTQHNCSFLDLIKLYYPHARGEIITIEVQEVGFGFGISFKLKEKIEDISKEILYRVEKSLEKEM